MNLLPHPRSLQRRSGYFLLPSRSTLQFDSGLTRDGVLLPIAARLQSAAKSAGTKLELDTVHRTQRPSAIRVLQGQRAPVQAGGYLLEIGGEGVTLIYRDEGGLHAGVATLRQILREHGRRLPWLTIRDWPDFPRRGVMLDVSRGRVPRLETLMELTSHLADFKINEFQLYTEHTFAYRKYRPVWRDWGALTGPEIRKLNSHCRGLGIELVPNQNSFGHLREWLAYPPLKKLAEVAEPWPDEGGAFLRRPSTLAPNNPGTLPFLRELYDELLPNFTSNRFNVGCDETWDLGRGQSRKLCEKLGRGRVYLEFLKTIHHEVTSRKRQMMFWGDIILHYPELVAELPRNAIALNWGYEADHPFERETALFARSKIPFYVCPGTSTWMSLIGRHDNAFVNLRRAAESGRKRGAIGYLITDWGDGGHSQPLAVSYIPYLLGAALSWCAATCDEKLLVPVLNRDVFEDRTGHAARAAFELGFAHRKLRHNVVNGTPLGSTIAAPPPRLRELFCRDGLKYFSRIKGRNVRAALEEIETQSANLRRARAGSRSAAILVRELDLAARMAAQSCKFMLWQQALAGGRQRETRALARKAVAELQQIEKEFTACWPLRNKATPVKCAAFLHWRVADYLRGVQLGPEKWRW